MSGTVQVKGKKRIKIAVGSEGMRSKGKRSILFSGIVVLVAFFMVWAGAAVGSAISPPNQVVLQKQSIAQYVYNDSAKAIPFANVNGQIEYPMTSGQNVSYVETNATLAELNSRDVGKLTLNFSQASSSPSASPDALPASYYVQFNETGLPANTTWGVVDYGTGSVGTTNTTSLKVATSSGQPVLYGIFPQSMHPSQDYVTVTTNGLSYVDVAFNAPQPSYYLYSLSHDGNVTISGIHPTYSSGNESGVNLSNVSRIQVGSDPVVMQTFGGYTYVANHNSSNVSVIHGLRLLGSIAVGHQPDAIACYNGSIYVANNGSNSISVFGQHNLTVYRTISLAKGINPTSMSIGSFGPDAKLFITIANGSGNGYVAVVNLTGLQEYSVLYFQVGIGPVGIVYDETLPGASSISFLIPEKGSNEVLFWLYDFDTNSVPSSGSAMTISGPEAIFSAPFGGHIQFIVSNSTGTWSLIHLLTGSWVSYHLSTSIFRADTFVAGTAYFAAHGNLNMTFSNTNRTASHRWDPVALTSSTVANYSVTFNEKGLPMPVNWTVTFDGLKKMSNATSMTFYASNGTYSYSVQFVNTTGPVMGYAPFENGSGQLTVNGSAASESTTFYPAYAVTFDSGLTSRTNWTIVLSVNTTVIANGLRHSQTSISNVTVIAGVDNFTLPFLNSSLSFGGMSFELNYSYSLNAPNYVSSAISDSFRVNGSALTLNAITLSPYIAPSTTITVEIGFGTGPGNFVPFAYVKTNSSSLNVSIQPQYLTGNQSGYLMVRIQSNRSSVDMLLAVYGNSGISTYFGPITGEEIGYWLGSAMIFAGAFLAMPWHDIRFRRR